MFSNRRITTLLPLLMALASSVIVNAIPALRAFVLNEPEFIQMGWALYFVTVPGAVLQLVVGGIASAALAFIKNERAHTYIAYIITGLIGLSFVVLLIFVCQPT